MVHTSRTELQAEQTTATIRALSSLTRHDAASVKATVRAIGGGYLVEEHDDYDGYMSLLLTPAEASGPSYLVSGRTNSVDLAEIDADEMTARGTFASIGAAMITLRGMLESERDGSGDVRGVAEQLIATHGADAGLHAAMRADAGKPQWRAVLQAIDMHRQSGEH